MFTFFIVGCGYVGRALATDLTNAGHRVIGIRRNPPTEAKPTTNPGPERSFRKEGNVCKPALSWRAADVTRPETLSFFGDVEKVDGIFYLPSAARGGPGAAEAVYAQGAQHVIDALDAAGNGHKNTRLVYVSSTGVYGQTGGTWVDESSPTDPRIEAGQAMLVGEQAFLSARHIATAVRFSGLYGPERTRLVSAVERGEVMPGKAHRWLNQLHQADAAGILAHLVGLPPEDVPATLCASDPLPATRLEVLSWIARRIDHPPPRVDTDAPVPDPVRGNKRVDTTLLRQTGYTFQFPSYREGYGSLLS